MCDNACFLRGLEQELRKLGAKGIGNADVRDYAITEKCTMSAMGKIEELVRDYNLTRGVVFS